MVAQGILRIVLGGLVIGSVFLFGSCEEVAPNSAPAARVPTEEPPVTDDPPVPTEEPPIADDLPEQQPAAPATTGARVSISSTPSGAHVTIDGGAGNARRLAAAAAPITTPATIHLPPGDYTFTISKPGTGAAEGTVKVERNADVNLNITLSNSTVTDRLPEFDIPRLHYGHTTLFGPRLGVSLIEEHQYYPARDDEADKRIVRGVAATAGDPPYSYAMTGVPDGMVFDPDTRILYGTPAVGTALIWEGIYSITDADGDTTETEILFIVFPDSRPYFDSAVDDQTYQSGSEIVPLRLPEVKWTDITIPENTTDRSVTFGGRNEGTLPGSWGNRRLSDSISGLPPGLHVPYLYVRNLQRVPSGSITEPAAYFIVGTPLEVGTFRFTYTIVDSNGDTATLEVAITVFDPEPEPESEPTKTVPRLSISGSHIVYEDERNLNTSHTEMYYITMNLRSQEQVTVDIATEDGTARAGEDYSAISMTLIFGLDIWQQTVGVGIRSDSLVEPPETFFLRLSNAVNATIADEPERSLGRFAVTICDRGSSSACATPGEP